MMSNDKPNLAVIGSCVSRDSFNRRFAPDYKQRVNLIESVYQSAMPSLARVDAIETDIPTTLQPQFNEVMRREYSGQNLAKLAIASADIVVIDFFADIHFGVTKVGDNYTTRNHMAFNSTSDADEYFNDEGLSKPDRMRYETGRDGAQYHELALESIKTVIDTLRNQSHEPTIVLNSARMSRGYINAAGSEDNFPKLQRIEQKNKNWNEIDNLFQQLAGCARIEYPEELLKGSVQHPWGKHPVHYDQPYYDYFWNKLNKIIDNH